MKKRIYRERVQIIKSILEVPVKLKKPVSKHNLFKASNTNSAKFETIYKSLVSMGCLIEQKDSSNRYSITLSEKGLEFYTSLGNLMPFLKEFDRYRKE